MEMLLLFAVTTIYAAVVIGPILGLIYFAVSRAHRVCKSRKWPRVLASAVGVVFVLATLVPFAFFDATWALFWSILTLPFSLLLEFFASLGFSVFAIVTSIISAMFWSALVYVVSAIILRLRRV